MKNRDKLSRKSRDKREKFPALCVPQPFGIIRGVKQRSESMPVKFCDRIEINPAVCHGKPVVRGTRVMVSQVLGALAGGDSIEEVLMDYPSISSEDLSAVFSFAGTLASFEDVPYGNMSVAL